MPLPNIVTSSLEDLEFGQPEGRHYVERFVGLAPATIPEGYRTLDAFPGHTQKQTRWCWAAVGQSIHDHMRAARPGRPDTGPLEQCAIASTQYPDAECCGQGAAGACNRWGRLSTVLEAIGLPARKIVWEMPSMTVCGEEVRKGRPIPVRVEPKGGGRHFVVICGVGPSNHVLAWDPTGAWKSLNINDWNERVGTALNYYLLPQ